MQGDDSFSTRHLRPKPAPLAITKPTTPPTTSHFSSPAHSISPTSDPPYRLPTSSTLASFPTPRVLAPATNPPTVSWTTDIQAPPSVLGTTPTLITQPIQLPKLDLRDLFFRLPRTIHQNVAFIRTTTSNFIKLKDRVLEQV